MMNRMKFLAACAGVLALTATASAQTKWNLPSAYPNDNPHVENLNAFAKDVSDATGGKLQIAVHGGASLFKGPEIKRAVATGQAQAGEREAPRGPGHRGAVRRPLGPAGHLFEEGAQLHRGHEGLEVARLQRRHR